MAVTFIKKKHTCNNCGKQDYELFAIAKNTNITSEYPTDRQPAELKSDGIYIESTVRDDFGIILHRTVLEKPCTSCGAAALAADKVDNETPVLNFYPRTEAHKWLDGLGKAGL